MKYIPYLLLLLATACTQAGKDAEPTRDSTIVIPADTVAETRQRVADTPAVSYTEKVPDELNSWHFSVSLFETRKTFQYLVRVKYKEIRIADSVLIPNLGFLPRPSLRKGKTALSCIIGFLDKKGEFKDYKLVQVKDDRLKISTLNYYSVGHYRTNQP